jgi:Arc/MetJ family transcription regulator
MPTPVQRGSVLSAADAAASDQFGVGVALSSDAQILAVGANQWEGAAGTSRGGVYVDDWSGSSWSQRGSVIEAADAADTDLFGSCCCLSDDGSVLVVGAFQWEGAADNQGGVYVYDWSGSAWSQRGGVLTAGDAGLIDRYGYAVSISSDGLVLAVGSRSWDSAGGTERGAVYIYDWSGSSWVQRGSVLTPSDAADNDFFGVAVSLSGDGSILAVGAVGWEGASGSDRGGVYIYDWSGSAWVQRGSVLEASDAADGDDFGFGVAFSDDGNVLVVSARRWEGASGSNRGGVYIYDRSGSAWVQRGSVLEASDAADGDFYGRSVALADNAAVLVVGANAWEPGATADIGGVYTYTIQTEFTGAAAVVATASGILPQDIALAGTAAAIVTASAGSLSTGINLAGAAQGQASAGGELSTGIHLAGAVSVIASSTGLLSNAVTALDGDAQAQALAAGDLVTEIRLNAAAVAEALAAAGLSTGVQLAGDAQIQVTAAASLIDLIGSASAEALASGSLTTEIRVNGAAVAEALAAAGLTTDIKLSGSAAAEALASANLTVQIRFSSAAIAEALASAGLDTAILLQGNAGAAANADGYLTTIQWIGGSASGQAASAGALTYAPLPARTFILGGLSLPFESHLDLNQDYDEERASTITRHCDGSARKQTAWRGKVKTKITGRGWIPPGFGMLDFSAPLEMSCIALRAVTSSGNAITIPAARRNDQGFEPFAYATVNGGKVDAALSLAGDVATVGAVSGAAFYTVCYYPKIQVYASEPTQRHDAIGDIYFWDFEAREV